MGTELRLHLDQHLLDRVEALQLLYQETATAQPVGREDLFRRVFEEGLSALLQDALVRREPHFMPGCDQRSTLRSQSASSGSPGNGPGGLFQGRAAWIARAESATIESESA
jgi:hypothetical protein